MNNKTELDELIEGHYEWGFVHHMKDKKAFFDETNNCRKIRIGTEKDNVEHLDNMFFVLGGIVIENNLDFKDLLENIEAKQEPVDPKFSFFANGKKTFEEAIKQKRLALLLKYLDRKGVLIHYHLVHYLHYSLVEILDSIINGDKVLEHMVLSNYRECQSDMTEVLLVNYDKLHDLLVKYSFPNVEKTLSSSFIHDLLELYSNNLKSFDLDDPSNENKLFLEQVIRCNLSRETLLFLHDNVSNLISHGVWEHYISRMVELDCPKTFDEEKEIQTFLSENFAGYEKRLDVQYADSKNCPEIQVSDAIVALISKMYSFLFRKTKNDLYVFVSELDEQSANTLYYLFRLIEKSDEESKLLLKKTAPLYIEEKFEVLYKLTENNKVFLNIVD